MQEQSKNKIITSIVIIAAIALIAIAARGNKSDQTGQITQPTASSANIVEAADPNATYKDGSYTVADKYQSPGGAESIDVTVTISNGMITDAQVSASGNDRESEEYQTRFKNNYKSKVVGKALSTLELSRISGASLTTSSFNDALDAIRAQAKA